MGTLNAPAAAGLPTAQVGFVVSAPASGNLCGRGHLPDADVATQVRSLLAQAYGEDRFDERRQAHRYPYPHLAMLTPVLPNGALQDGPPIVASCKQLSESGLGFFHPSPLPFRRVICSLEASRNKWIAFLMDLNWCRFNHFGWYESGGRFLQITESPLQGKR